MKELFFKFPVQIVKTYEDPEKEFHVTGYVATSSLDLQEDVIAPQALDLTEKDFATQTTLFNHHPDQPIGRMFECKKTKKGLWVDVIIDKAAKIKETGSLVIDLIKQKILNKFSIRAKIVSASRKFLAELGKVVNYVTRILPVEASLVTIAANPDAESIGWYEKSLLEPPRAIGWYLTKALAEYQEGGNTMDGILESDGFPEIVEEDFFKDLGEPLKGEFPKEEEVCQAFEDFLKEKGLTESVKEEEINKAWEEFCKAQEFPGVPHFPFPQKRFPFPKIGEYAFPNPDISKETVKEIFFLLDKLEKGPNEKIKAIAKQIKAMIARATDYPKPVPEYPKPYPYPKPKELTDEDKKKLTEQFGQEKFEKLFEVLGDDIKDLVKNDGPRNDDERLIAHFGKEKAKKMKELLGDKVFECLPPRGSAKKDGEEMTEKQVQETVKKLVDEKIKELIDAKMKEVLEKQPTLRKGLIPDEEATGSLEKALKGKSEEEKLKILIALEGKE